MTLCPSPSRICQWHSGSTGCDALTRARSAERYAAFVAPTHATALSLDFPVEPGPAYIPFQAGGVWQVRTSTRNEIVPLTACKEIWQRLLATLIKPMVDRKSVV